LALNAEVYFSPDLTTMACHPGVKINLGNGEKLPRNYTK
jgi:hypothetical protein